MNINYWDCDFSDYNEFWDGEEETRIYGCTHPCGSGICNLNNKYCNEKEDCKLIDDETLSITCLRIETK